VPKQPKKKVLKSLDESTLSRGDKIDESFIEAKEEAKVQKISTVRSKMSKTSSKRLNKSMHEEQGLTDSENLELRALRRRYGW
jgi:hypothetical protein